MQSVKNTSHDLIEKADNGLVEEEVFVFPATVGQRRFWILDQHKPGNPALNFALSARLQGRVDQGVLERTINEIIRRHEILRTSFRTVDGEVMQVIHPKRTTTLDWHDVSGCPEAIRDAEVQKLRLEDAGRSFSLTTDPLLRAGLVKVNEDDYVLNLSMHHIACDGMSNGVLIPEIAKIYTALMTGQPLPPELPLQYADYAQWQNDWLTSPEAARERDHWRSQFKGVLPTLNLPTDRPRFVGRAHSGTIETLLLPKSLTDPLKELCVREDATFFMLILAVYGLILYRYTGNPDIIMGAPAANRNQTNLEGLIGLFTNPLLMRMDFSGNPTMRTLLARVKHVSLDAYAHQSYPFEKLAEEIQIDPNRLGVQWLQMYFVFQKAFMLPQQMPGVTLTPIRSVSCGAIFEWLLAVIERAEGFRLQPEYDTDLYDKATIDRMLHHFRRALETFLADPDVRVDQLPILTPAEQREFLDWNASKFEVPHGRSVNELFEEQVRKTPDAPALFDGQTQLTYAELNRKANQLAHYLHTAGLKPEARIGLASDLRSSSFVIGFLGVLKAGGCCVFLDRNQGDAVLQRNINAANLDILLTDSSLPAGIQPSSLRAIHLGMKSAAIANQSDTDMPNSAQLQHAACLRFSVGRSGMPKITVITHQALVNAAWVAANQFGLTGEDRISGALDEILPVLLTGACWVTSSGSAKFNAVDWWQWVKKERITVATLPTPCWHELVRQWPASEDVLTTRLRLVAVGGDNISPTALTFWQQFVQGQIRLLNRYNLAETAGAVAYTDPFSTQEIPGQVTISRPAPNARLYVLDANLQPVPAGVPGDIYVGGDSLASGYPAESAANHNDFISDPIQVQSGNRLLKTGDRGRFLAGKGIELTGRVEELAKTHGFRLELCELRWVLCKCPGVWDAIIEPRTDVEKSLVAHLLSTPGTTLKSTEVLAFLKKNLPVYMIPNAIFVWDEFPIGADGLVDRQGLASRQIEVEAPFQNGAIMLNPTEQALMSIWKDVLKVKHIGIKDNFFEIGGHSLLAMQLISRIKRDLKSDMPVGTIFRHPTIEGLVNFLSAGPVKERKPELVHLQTGDSGPELIFLIDEGSLSLFKLARLMGEGLSLYASVVPLPESALKASARKDLSALPRMEDLAAMHVALIKHRNTGRPMVLAGHCFGGRLAFEVAQQLQRDGQSVAAVLMLDTWMIRTTRWWRKKTWLKAHLGKLLQQGPLYFWQKSRRRLNLEKDALASRLKLIANDDFSVHVPWAIIERIYRQASISYQPKPLATKGISFVSKDDWQSNAYRKLDNSLGAAQWFAGGVEVLDAPGDHVTVLDEPNLPELAESYKKGLEKLQLVPNRL